jgi:glycogen(starch) synthase
MADIKTDMWRDHHIPLATADNLVDQTLAFGYLVNLFYRELSRQNAGERRIIAHFHEWMAGVAIPQMRKENLDVSIVFTTHATMLGRYLAMNKSMFYKDLPYFDWEVEAKNYLIEPQVHIERAAAHGAHVFTTVSEVTARECSNSLAVTRT